MFRLYIMENYRFNYLNFIQFAVQKCPINYMFHYNVSLNQCLVDTLVFLSSCHLFGLTNPNQVSDALSISVEFDCVYFTMPTDKCQISCRVRVCKVFVQSILSVAFCIALTIYTLN